MNNTIRYVLIALFTFFGVVRLYGVFAHYNEHQEIDWWKLAIGILFITSAVLQYTRIRKNTL